MTARYRYLFEGEQRSYREVREMLPAFVGETTIRRMLDAGVSNAQHIIDYAQRYRGVRKEQRGSAVTPWRRDYTGAARLAAERKAARLRTLLRIAARKGTKP